ncbi:MULTISPECIES: hypothetical protein [Corallincola]|uniref:DUF4878 domain-containing protein n=3 Tax=Corallincola TaxID=1775176 RepID=A0A368NTM6_9GAMM|nr:MULTISPECIES: hypothetical protein [Corallincola]RCU52849.1 hypothetical protein DU002_02475 [Corallincola holothuriorum]TAA47999.1 hypothetical protein EXY25_01775 [Corallincola spongiicola]TCI03347.1 hypothetical protein EZV61_10760 [Corallincola luteus]
MKARRINALISLLCAFLLLTGCEEKVSTPEQAAIDFFAAIYIRADVNEATKYCMPELAELLVHYRSAHSVKRHVVGLSMNDVELTLSDTDADFFRKVATQAQVTVHFKGKIDGGVREDERTVIVVKKGLEWYVESIKPDIFMTNG